MNPYAWRSLSLRVVTGCSASPYVMVSSSFSSIALRALSVSVASPLTHTASTFGSHEWFSSDGPPYSAVPCPAPSADDASAASIAERKSDDDEGHPAAGDATRVVSPARPWSWSHPPETPAHASPS